MTLFKNFIKTKINLKLVAFTLAEVLITLGIIGIVAEITIPTLIQNTNKREYEVALKKTYSNLSEVIKRISYDNGGSFSGVASASSDYPALFGQYMRTLKTCSSDVSTTGCWHNANKWFYYAGGPIGAEATSSGLITSNGSFITFMQLASDCTSNIELNAPVGCTRVRVDVNGIKSPNKVARDIFDFYILKDRIIPRGHPLTDTSGFSCPDVSEWSCTQKVILSGMTY